MGAVIFIVLMLSLDISGAYNNVPYKYFLLILLKVLSKTALIKLPN